MIRANVAADVLANIQSCLGAGCDYVLMRSRGIPPAECNSIAVTWTDAEPRYEQDCQRLAACDRQTEHVLRIIITRCCVTADSGLSFNAAAEDDAAMCLWRDTEIVESCMDCTDWTQLGIDHGIVELRRVSTRFDVETMGGCNSAYVEVRVVSEECCT